MLTLLFAALALPQSLPQGDVLFADFEGQGYGAWKVEGEAFGSGPARGTLPGQMEVSGFRGKGLVDSFLHGDGSTGRTARAYPIGYHAAYQQALDAASDHGFLIVGHDENSLMPSRTSG